MRISDWSSDVCSSDLSQLPDPWSGTLNHASRAKSICKKTARLIAKSGKLDYYRSPDNRSPPATWLFFTVDDLVAGTAITTPQVRISASWQRNGCASWQSAQSRAPVRSWLSSLLTSRSEEHTSELQSLMRISYAV